LISRALLVWSALWLAIADLGASGDWITLENCRIVPNPANDGDSFHVRVNEKDYVFRLYFVDAPETDAANPARLIEQAKHFEISVPQVIEVGEIAREFTRDKLAEPFTVVTRTANAMGRSNTERFYAFVQTKDGDLGEQLVANGLARIYGRRVTPPGAQVLLPNSRNSKNPKLRQSSINLEAGPRRLDQQRRFRARARTSDCSLPSSISTLRRKKN
jgi:endonuclease YncB( thermonuclease family)